jgi:Phage capsid family.
MEYREAFMNYVQRGIKSDILEFRADANTTTTTAATVIPKTVMDEIIRESKVSGNILSKVRKMNVKGGVQIPTLSAVPTASWITEAATSDRKALTTGSITFSYYGLEVKIAQTLLSEYTSIDAFEREFATLAVEAMTNAKEIAIFNGSGTGQPTGILKDTTVTEATLTAANLVKWDKLVEAVGKLPVAYRTGAEFAMAAGTWDKLVGMVDTAGQPIARVNTVSTVLHIVCSDIL